MIETPQQFFLRVACALAETVAEALELYRLFSSLEYLPSSPTLFNAGTRHEQLSSCFLLDSPDDHLEAIYQRYTDVALLSKFSGGIGLAYHRVRSRGSLIREHQRPLERHRAVAQDARRVGRGRQPGRQAQGRVLRLPRALARRHRGVPRAARQHRRRGAPHAQPEPRELDPGPVHAARRGGRRRGACSIPKVVPAAARPLRRGVRAAPTTRPRRPGSPRKTVQGARPLRADDADAGADRQRLDDVQGRVATARATRPRCPGARRAPVEPVHRDPRGDVGRTRPRSATWARSTSAATSTDGRASTSSKLARTVRTRGAPARPRDRPQLLPDRADAARRTSAGGRSGSA